MPYTVFVTDLDFNPISVTEFRYLYEASEFASEQVEIFTEQEFAKEVKIRGAIMFKNPDKGVCVSIELD